MHIGQMPTMQAPATSISMEEVQLLEMAKNAQKNFKNKATNQQLIALLMAAKNNTGYLDSNADKVRKLRPYVVAELYERGLLVEPSAAAVSRSAAAPVAASKDMLGKHITFGAGGLVAGVALGWFLWNRGV